MPISAAFLPEFDHEMATTRKCLERVPEDKFDWRPHEKSFTLQQLASHLANLPHWAELGLKHDTFDMAPPGEEPPRTPQASSVDDLLAKFDANVAEGRAAIASTEDPTYHQTWSLVGGDKTFLTIPKVAVVRSFVLNHMIHHRGQLSVYLRLLNVPVPSIFGPSADEQVF